MGPLLLRLQERCLRLAVELCGMADRLRPDMWLWMRLRAWGRLQVGTLPHKALAAGVDIEV